MDFDIFVKAVTCLLGAVGAMMGFYKISIGRQSRLREEYKFAKEFLDAVMMKESLHPFLRDKGYQAIAGTNNLNPDVIEYLLSLQGPELALKDYVVGRPYLEHLPQVGASRIEFKNKYRGNWSRKWRWCFYVGLYFVLCFFACAPLLLPQWLFKGQTQGLLMFVTCLVVFGPYAWFSLKTAHRIRRAEHLVQHQHKHTRKILLSP